jgi:4-amino-4-deoxy-L-arabinose transferase-like glycosyltransferase
MQEAASPISTRRDLSLLLAFVVGILLLFLGKAFTVDDTLFLKLAQQIRHHPLDFYGFDVNWYGFVMPMSEVTKNPPFAGYFIALVGSVFGWNEWALHLAFLLPACFAASGMYFVARRFCDRPLLASLLGLLSPVFVVSSTNIMCDVMMLAFWLWAVEFWLRWMERSNWRWGVAAGALIALAGLTKYFGFALLPLLLVDGGLRKRRLGSWALPLLIPTLSMLAYDGHTSRLYGRGLFLDALANTGPARSLAHGLEWNALAQLIIGPVFVGGCVVAALCFFPLLWPRRGLALGVLAFVAGFATLYTGSVRGLEPEGARLTADWSFALQGALMLVGGLSLLAVALLDLKRSRDPDAVLLFLWLVGAYLFAAHLNWVNNGRSNLPLIPVAGIYIMRRFRALDGGRTLHFGRFRMTALWSCAAIALAVGFADAGWANNSRQAAARILREYGNKTRRIYFQGHWGFQHYMERAGAFAVDVGSDELSAGAILVVPRQNTDVYPMSSSGGHVDRLDTVWLDRPLLHTMAAEAGAGFYATLWGPLPFALGRLDPESYDIFEVVKDFRGNINREAQIHW